MMLELCDGPECPRCGCRDSEILQEPTGGSWFAGGRARCRHCRTAFSFRESNPSEEAPAETPTKCPACDGPFWVYKTGGSVQYRKCRACGHKGKTPAAA